jgi:hypothetical protein
MVTRHQQLIVFLAMLSVQFYSNAAEEQICDGSESIVTRSQSGNWVASVQEQVCTTDKGASAAITVIVASKDSPYEGIRVVSTAVPRSRDEWPRVVWRTETTLEVWVPNFSQVLEVKPAFRDVVVTLKYCADDPEARARVAKYQVDVKRWQEEVTRWAKLRKVDPDAAGQRPTRPEEPRAVSQPCQAGDIP